jgi:acetyltransferase-like isoleucine patch superfamily enzyme
VKLLRHAALKAGLLASFPFRGSYIHPTVALGMSAGSQIRLGRQTRVGRRSMIYLRDGSTLTIGDDTIIGHYANIRVGSIIEIGSHVRFAQFVSVLGDNHRFDRLDIPIAAQGVEPAPVRIGDDVWLGAGAIVLAGVTIGRGSVVGAGAVVTHDVAEHTIVAGNPARVLRRRGEPAR